MAPNHPLIFRCKADASSIAESCLGPCRRGRSAPSPGGAGTLRVSQATLPKLGGFLLLSALPAQHREEEYLRLLALLPTGAL